MDVQYAGSQFMTRRMIEVIQELCDYLGPEAQGWSDESVHTVMFKALDFQQLLNQECNPYIG